MWPYLVDDSVACCEEGRGAVGGRGPALDRPPVMTSGLEPREVAVGSLDLACPGPLVPVEAVQLTAQPCLT